MFKDFNFFLPLLFIVLAILTLFFLILLLLRRSINKSKKVLISIPLTILILLLLIYTPSFYVKEEEVLATWEIKLTPSYREREANTIKPAKRIVYLYIKTRSKYFITMQFESEKLVKYFETIKKKEIKLTYQRSYTFYKPSRVSQLIKINNLSSILGEKVKSLCRNISH